MPTYGEIAQIITALAATGAVVVSLRNSRKISDIHVLMNSRLDQLLKTTGDAEYAKGVKNRPKGSGNEE